MSMDHKSDRWWTSQQLRDAIERCNAECEQMLAQHAPAEAIESRRKSISHLMRLLCNVERMELEEKEKQA